MDLRNHLRISFGIVALVWSIWLFWYGPEVAFSAVRDWWPITVTMMFGSVIAGATSEGGGAIAFPVFTKVLHIAPWDAKLFALAIQGVGMTAASVVIVLMGIKVDWRVIIWASIGGALGMAFGATGPAHYLPPDVTKITFTVMVSSFGVVLYVLNRRERSHHEQLPANGTVEVSLLVAVGALGGFLSSVVGTGLDIVTFSCLVILFRVSEKVATPTSVILMAVNSLVGCFVYFGLLGEMTDEVHGYWMAAIPVVVVGAPVGAMLCSYMSRRTIANLLIGLIFIDLVSTVLVMPLTTELMMYSTVAMLVCFTFYASMIRVERYKPVTIEET